MNASDSLHYTQCGLDNVYLLNGYEWISIQGGEEVLRIIDMDGLNDAIAKSIIDNPASLDAQTFRYLRKHLDMAQRQIARILDVEEQTISLWERAKQTIPRSADIVLRVLAQEHGNGNTKLTDLIERFNQLDRDHHEETIQLCQQGGVWREAAA